MSIGSGSPAGGVGSAGISGVAGGWSGIAGTSGTASGTWYSACIAGRDVPGRLPGETDAGRGNQPHPGCVVPADARVPPRPFCCALFLLAEAPAPSATSEEAARVFAVSGARTAAVQSYVSNLHVDFALLSFPYLKFHLDGKITYQRPNVYSVHFDHVPWFGKGFENIKADALQPATWGEHYDIDKVAHDGDRTIVEMRDKTTGHVKGVRAELDTDGLRRIVWTYLNGGKIAVSIVPTTVSGAPVPASEDADIALPSYHVTAHATFTDYKIVTDAGTVAERAR